MLAAGPNFDRHQVIHFAPVYTLDAGDHRFGDYIFLEFSVVAEFLGDLLEQFHHPFAVLTVIHGHMQAHLRPITSHVAHNLNGAVRDNVKRAVGVTQGCATHAYAFHSAADACSAYGVAHFKLVFHQDEETVDHVFHQCLRSETDGQSSNPCAGQQRFNVDVERVFQHRHASEKHNQEHPGAANHSCHSADLMRAEGTLR